MEEMKRAREAQEKEECEWEEALLRAAEEEEKREAERKQWEEEERKRWVEATLEAEQELREQGGDWTSHWRSSGGTNRGRKNRRRWTQKTGGHALAAGQGRWNVFKSKYFFFKKKILILDRKSVV